MEPKINLVEAVGLCTSIALQRLATAIEEELRTNEARLGCSSGWFHLPLGSHSSRAGAAIPSGRASSPRDVLHLRSAGLIGLAVALAAVAAGFGPEGSLFVELAVLASLLLLNLGLVYWDSHLRQTEMINHTRDVLHKLKELQACEIHWPTDVYSPLFMPTTQSITEQWTYRDGHLVSLPTSLLVKDDVILVRPGQASPTTVCSFDDHSVQVQRGEKFQQASFAPTSKPTARQPLKPLKFIVQDMPYIPHLRACLQQDNGKPAPLLEVKRTLCVGIAERWLVPCVLGVSLCINILRFVFCGHDVGLWSEMLITLQVNTILPLLSLTVPLLWIILISYGNARIVTLFHKAKYEQSDITEYPGDKMGEEPEVKDEKLSWRELWEHFLSAFFGPSSHLPRSASLLYGLGTITSLCCVDKRGILSFPDPTIEKVFFMSNLREDSDGSEASSDSESDVFVSSQEQLLEAGKKGVTIASQEKLIDSEDYFPEYHTEVLTLSLDSTQNPTSLQFDETNWERHINSLKPMGLNILLNTCNPDTVEKYSHFFNHVHSTVNSDDGMEPLWVAHRRCMCQLAYLIGFTEQATQTYEMHQQLALYHPVNLESEDRHHAHRTRSFIKKRTPIPHIMSVLMKDSRGGANQLLTEGTAELVLSLCTDFWDGSDLSPLDDNDRKKILDFYQRAALSSYCCAFAYQPMADSVAKYFDDLYVELPPGGKAGRPPPDFDNFGVARSSWDVDMTTSHRDSKREEETEGSRRKFHSLDSPMDRRNNIRDAEDCFRAQCGQIFIGMVAMNYQAKPDIVALIENLDHACVRFVHFSRDQELRSRVFSEKMGLEAGWNCHISLQSETSSGGVSRQHSEQSSSIKSDPSRRSLEVAASLGAGSVGSTDHPKEVEADVAALKVLWHSQGEVEGAAGRERTRSGGKESKRDVTLPARIPEEEDLEEEERVDETSHLLGPTSSPGLSPNSLPPASTNHGTPSPTSNPGAGSDNSTAVPCSDSAPNGPTADQASESIETRREDSGEAEGHPDETAALLLPDSSSPVHRPVLEGSRSADSVEPLHSAHAHAHLHPHFADSCPPDVLVSSDGSCRPAGQKSNLEVLSEEMSVSWRERNVSDAARTMSDDTETLSHVTESETAVGFDISNRAKLPRGIEKIRPHLETVDNVPLLVPLFTDVTPETTKEMLRIMQDYGEVVCCLGSSLNLLNMPLFAQADISIGVEPLHPHVCLHCPQPHPQPQPQPQSLSGPTPYWHTPSGLASLLTSLPCSMSFLCNHNFSLFSLVQEARGLYTALCTVFTFLMFALLSMSGLQLLASALLLPPPLAGRHVLWLAVVVAPILATSLFPSQLNRQTMTSATGKNLKHRDNQMIQLYAFYFLARFAVSLFAVLLCHALTLHALCQKVTASDVSSYDDANATDSCHLLLGDRNSTSLWNGLKGEHSAHLVLAQNIQTALLVLYLIVTSVTYVHNLKPLWKKHPFSNHMWCATVLILLLLQVIYFVLDVRIWSGVSPVHASLADVPLAVWLIAFLWPLAILVLNEAVKLIEIRVFVRWQRRTQLQFGTKLGMNSPF